MPKQKRLVFTIEYRVDPEDADVPAVLETLRNAITSTAEAEVVDVRTVSVDVPDESAPPTGRAER